MRAHFAFIALFGIVIWLWFRLRQSRWFQLFNVIYMPSGDAFTFSLESFYAYKLFNLNLHGRTIFIAAAEHYANR